MARIPSLDIAITPALHMQKALASSVFAYTKSSMVFDWDVAKHEANIAKPDRGFGFDFAALIFDGETIEVEDTRRDYGETRMQAIGEAHGVVLFVVYTDRLETRWIISARKADRKERTAWRER